MAASLCCGRLVHNEQQVVDRNACAEAVITLA